MNTAVFIFFRKNEGSMKNILYGKHVIHALLFGEANNKAKRIHIIVSFFDDYSIPHKYEQSVGNL